MNNATRRWNWHKENRDNPAMELPRLVSMLGRYQLKRLRARAALSLHRGKLVLHLRDIVRMKTEFH
jgi:hypothetical protein